MDSDLCKKEPQVKLLIGVLYPEEALWEWTRKELESHFGAIERISDPFPFNWTHYYDEISPHLLRRFISLKGLQKAGKIAEWKHSAIALEKKSGFPRRVNIDPGYLDGARLVLASTKDNAHRIYLREGIFAEVTLCYRKGHWVSFEYTFPDFKSGIYAEFFNQVRHDWCKDKRRDQDGGVGF